MEQWLICDAIFSRFDLQSCKGLEYIRLLPNPVGSTATTTFPVHKFIIACSCSLFIYFTVFLLSFPYNYKQLEIIIGREPITVKIRRFRPIGISDFWRPPIQKISPVRAACGGWRSFLPFLSPFPPPSIFRPARIFLLARIFARPSDLIERQIATLAKLFDECSTCFYCWCFSVRLSSMVKHDRCFGF